MKNKKRIGWISGAHFPITHEYDFGALGYSVDMRISNVALWMNENSDSFINEMYQPGRWYDIVIFFKTHSDGCVEEMKILKNAGVVTIFDANINVYEVWGEYPIEGTKPSRKLQEQTIEITSLADYVIADSSYLHTIVQRYNKNVVCIHDNVDTSLFCLRSQKKTGEKIRLVWSGVDKKGYHLMLIKDVLKRLTNVELILVSNNRPAVMTELEKVVFCHYEKYSNKRYADVLSKADIIISPKYLNNAYAVAHSEYKITLGMAAGLPAVASPQQSYIEAIERYGGGIICTSLEEWWTSLNRLIKEEAYRNHLGQLARKTVEEFYSTPVIAKRYMEYLCSILSI